MDQGITVHPTPITSGDMIEVRYNGLLHRDGADQVYLRTGYGRNNDWASINELKMNKDAVGWKATLQVNTEERFNFCFHDSAQNWDNNNGKNWSFEVHNGELY